jgi:hypothetical protein
MKFATIVLATVLLVTGCRPFSPAPAGPETVEPETAGIVTAIVPVRGALVRWSLSTGATVEFDLNHTILAYQNAIPAVGNLVIAGSMSHGRWVMQVGRGALGSPPDCLLMNLQAFDRGNVIDFNVLTDENLDVQGGWHVRLPKTATFGWKPHGSPMSDGRYRLFTTFCLNERGEVAGQPPQ